MIVGAAAAALTAIPGVLFAVFAPHSDLLRLSAQQALTIAAFAGAGLLSLALAVFVIYPPTLGGLSLVGAAAVAREPVQTAEVIRRAVDRALPASGAFAAAFAAAAGPPIVLGVAAALVRTAVGLKPALPLVALFVIACAVSVPVAIRSSIAIPIVVVEDVAPVAAVRRSWEMMRGAGWWALGVYVVIGAFAAFVSGILGVEFLGGRLADAGWFLIAAVRNAAAVIVSVSVLGVAAGVIYASREVPPDASDGPAGSSNVPPRPVPVPIPLHAFDPPSPRTGDAE